MKKKILIALLILVLLLLGLIAAILIYGDSIASNYVQKHSKELIGRQLQLDKLSIKPFKGEILITNFDLKETDDTSTFVQFDTLYVNLSLWQLTKGELLCEALHLNGLDVSITKENDTFNFADLTAVDSTKVEEPKDTTAEPFIKKFTVRDIQITNGDIQYQDQDLQAQHELLDLDIRLPEISVDETHTEAGLAFGIGQGGRFVTNIDVDLDTRRFDWSIQIEDLDIRPYEPYIEPFVRLSSIDGMVHGRLLVHGNMDHPDKPKLEGVVSIHDFDLQDQEEKPVASFDSLRIDMQEINLSENKFLISSIYLEKPHIHYTLRSSGDNLSSLAIPQEGEEETEAPQADTSAPLFYRVDKVQINNGQASVRDYTVKPESFAYEVTVFNFSSTAIQPNTASTFDISAHLSGKGRIEGQVHMTPDHPADGTYEIHMRNTPLEDFSPYSIAATGYPLEGGRLDFKTENTIKDNYLTSHIDIKLFNTEIGDKRKDVEPESNVPVKLGKLVMEDPSKQIKINTKAEGDLDDPNFSFAGVVWKVVKNIIIKAAASPFNIMAKTVGVNPDDLKELKIEMLQTRAETQQNYQLDGIVDLLKQKPDLHVICQLEMDVDKEQKALKEFIPKRDFYVEQVLKSKEPYPPLSREDEIAIIDMDFDDKLIRFMEKRTKSKKGEKSLKQLVDVYSTKTQVQEEHDRINKSRYDQLETFFTKKGLEGRFEMKRNVEHNSQKDKPRFNFTYTVPE